MKNKIKSGIKIYLFTLLFILLVCIAYSFYLSKSGNDFHLIAKLVIGGLAFLILGLAYANAIHKKGLIIGIVMALLHIFIIKTILFLATGSFDFNIFLILIYTLCGGIGGFIGGNIKKIF